MAFLRNNSQLAGLFQAYKWIKVEMVAQPRILQKYNPEIMGKEMEPMAILHAFRYEAEGEWLPLPNWALFIAEIAWQATTQKREGERLTIAISVPVCSQAALLAALGVIIGLSVIPVAKTYDKDNDFEALCTLERGTPLVYYKNNRKLKAVFAGVTGFEGQKRIRIQYESDASGALTDLVSENEIHMVVRDTLHQEALELPKHQIGRYFVACSDFLEALLGKEALNEYILKAQLDCAIFGCINQIKEVATGQMFGLERSDEIITGKLNEIIRLKNVYGEDQPYRSVALAADRSSQKLDDFAVAPRLVVYEGAIAFLKQRYCWQNNNRLVILDRTERNYQEGVDLVNELYTGRLSSWKNPVLSDIPPPVECTAFWERV